MNKKINDLYKKVNDLMKASNTFDVKQYESVLDELQNIIGKELDRDDEETMEGKLSKNIIEAILKAVEGEPSLDKVSIVEQIVSQAGVDYRTFKSKYMNDGIQFFIDYLENQKIVEQPSNETDDGTK